MSTYRFPVGIGFACDSNDGPGTYFDRENGSVYAYGPLSVTDPADKRFWSGVIPIKVWSPDSNAEPPPNYSDLEGAYGYLGSNLNISLEFVPADLDLHPEMTYPVTKIVLSVGEVVILAYEGAAIPLSDFNDELFTLNPEELPAGYSSDLLPTDPLLSMVAHSYIDDGAYPSSAGVMVTMGLSPTGEDDEEELPEDPPPPEPEPEPAPAGGWGLTPAMLAARRNETEPEQAAVDRYLLISAADAGKLVRLAQAGALAIRMVPVPSAVAPDGFVEVRND